MLSCAFQSSCTTHSAQNVKAVQKQQKSQEHPCIQWWVSAPQAYMKPLAKTKKILVLYHPKHVL